MSQDKGAEEAHQNNKQAYTIFPISRFLIPAVIHCHLPLKSLSPSSPECPSMSASIIGEIDKAPPIAPVGSRPIVFSPAAYQNLLPFSASHCLRAAKSGKACSTRCQKILLWRGSCRWTNSCTTI